MATRSLLAVVSPAVDQPIALDRARVRVAAGDVIEGPRWGSSFPVLISSPASGLAPPQSTRMVSTNGKLREAESVRRIRHNHRVFIAPTSDRPIDSYAARCISPHAHFQEHAGGRVTLTILVATPALHRSLQRTPTLRAVAMICSHPATCRMTACADGGHGAFCATVARWLTDNSRHREANGEYQGTHNNDTHLR